MMNKYRTIRLLMLAGQVGTFAVLAVHKIDNIYPMAGWSWWLICLPLYAPLILSTSLVLISMIWHKAYNHIYPPSPSTLSKPSNLTTNGRTGSTGSTGSSYRTHDTYRSVSSTRRNYYRDL